LIERTNRQRLPDQLIKVWQPFIVLNNAPENDSAMVGFYFFYKMALPVLTLSVAILVGCGGNESAPHAEIPVHLQSYIKAQEALANDDFAAAKKALQALGDHLEGTLQTAAKAAADAADIAALRTAFKAFSEGLASAEIPPGYAVAFCPMADDDQGARWIQKKGEIANPYFGSSMLICGAFEGEY